MKTDFQAVASPPENLARMVVTRDNLSSWDLTPAIFEVDGKVVGTPLEINERFSLDLEPGLHELKVYPRLEGRRWDTTENQYFPAGKVTFVVITHTQLNPPQEKRELGEVASDALAGGLLGQFIFGGTGKYGPYRFEVTNTDLHSGSKNSKASNAASIEPKNAPEQYCSKIGYKSGTEKFADCVMKMMDGPAGARD
jgi:hypothetical protein